MSVARVVAVWAGEPGRSCVRAPTLSWSVESGREAWEQADAEVELRFDGEVRTAAVTGPVAQRVAQPFTALEPYTTAHLRVWVRGTGDAAGEQCAWSGWTELRTGPLGPQDWRAPFAT